MKLVHIVGFIIKKNPRGVFTLREEAYRICDAIKPYSTRPTQQSF